MAIHINDCPRVDTSGFYYAPVLEEQEGQLFQENPVAQGEAQAGEQLQLAAVRQGDGFMVIPITFVPDGNDAASPPISAPPTPDMGSRARGVNHGVDSPPLYPRALFNGDSDE
jgi:hypothetical protein